MTQKMNRDVDQQLTNINLLIRQLQNYKDKIMVEKYKSDIDEINAKLQKIFLVDVDPFYFEYEVSSLKAILQFVREPYENKLVLVHSSDDEPTIANYSSNLNDIKASFKEFTKLADNTKANKTIDPFFAEKENTTEEEEFNPFADPFANDKLNS